MGHFKITETAPVVALPSARLRREPGTKAREAALTLDLSLSSKCLITFSPITYPVRCSDQQPTNQMCVYSYWCVVLQFPVIPLVLSNVLVSDLQGWWLPSRCPSQIRTVVSSVPATSGLPHQSQPVQTPNGVVKPISWHTNGLPVHSVSIALSSGLPVLFIGSHSV